MEDKIQTLFTELRLGRPLSPKKSYHRESFAQSHQVRRDEFQGRGGSMTEPNYPCMRVDFPRWEEGDPIGWISRAERYFRYHKIADASMVKITSRNRCFFDDNSTLTRQHILAATSTDFCQTFVTIYHRSKTFNHSPKILLTTPSNFTQNCHKTSLNRSLHPSIHQSFRPSLLSTIHAFNLTTKERY